MGQVFPLLRVRFGSGNLLAPLALASVFMFVIPPTFSRGSLRHQLVST